MKNLFSSSFLFLKQETQHLIRFSLQAEEVCPLYLLTVGDQPGFHIDGRLERQRQQIRLTSREQGNTLLHTTH